MRPALIVPCAVAAGLLVLAACASGGPGYYVGTDGTAVARVEWSAPQDGHASGTLTDDTLTGAAPGRSVAVQTVPVTVTFQGSRVTFTGAGLYDLAGTFRGTLSGGMLSIQAPGASGYLESAVLRSGTATVYNADLATLKQHVRRDNEVAAQRTAHRHTPAQLASAQQAVSNDESSLASDLSQLSSDVAQTGTDTQQGNSDLQTLNSDAASGCTNSAAVTEDDATVNTDGSTVSSDATTVTADISTVDSDVSQLQKGERVVQQDGGVPRGDPNGAVSQAQAAISSAVSQANADITSINGYMQQAYTTANNLATMACPAADSTG